MWWMNYRNLLMSLAFQQKCFPAENTGRKQTNYFSQPHSWQLFTCWRIPTPAINAKTSPVSIRKKLLKKCKIFYVVIFLCFWIFHCKHSILEQKRNYHQGSPSKPGSYSGDTGEPIGLMIALICSILARRSACKGNDNTNVFVAAAKLFSFKAFQLHCFPATINKSHEHWQKNKS